MSSHGGQEGRRGVSESLVRCLLLRGKKLSHGGHGGQEGRPGVSESLVRCLLLRGKKLSHGGHGGHGGQEGRAVCFAVFGEMSAAQGKETVARRTRWARGAGCVSESLVRCLPLRGKKLSHGGSGGYGGQEGRGGCIRVFGGVWACWRKAKIDQNELSNCDGQRQTPNAKRQTPNAKRRTVNGER
jgi:hypothetical protein